MKLKIYNGGGEKDDLLTYVTGNLVPSPVSSIKNQMFISFTTNGIGVGKGFTTKIAFGNLIRTMSKEF